MKSAHRRRTGSLLALGAAIALATTSATLRAASVPASVETRANLVLVHPGPGSVLEFDAPQVLGVRDSLTNLLRQNPSCLAGKVRDALDAAYGDLVSENAFPPDYVMKWVVDHWEHWCIEPTEFEVDFGAGRTVQVRVEESELKN